MLPRTANGREVLTLVNTPAYPSFAPAPQPSLPRWRNPAIYGKPLNVVFTGIPGGHYPVPRRCISWVPPLLPMFDHKYRPDVDGLRALAVTLVVLFHAKLGFPGGYIGVDIFFVISGFLITGLILKAQAAGRFSLRDFWVRRLRRILPAATVMVATVLLAGFFLLLPGDFSELSQSAIAQQLMVANIYFQQNTGYFDGAADVKPLLHTWSLAVEEQFYLVYPFLLVLLSRFSRRAMASVLACLAVVSLVVSEYWLRHEAGDAYFLLPSRAWELLLGGVICFLPAPTWIHPRLRGLLGWLALGAIVAAGCCYTAGTSFPGLAALVPCVATAFLIYANSAQLSSPAALLATRPMVSIGLMSYSLYLWHWPVLAFSRYWLDNHLTPTMGLAAIAASGVLAYVSWRFVETPLRNPSTVYRPRFVFSGAAAAAAVVLGLSGWIYANDGFIERLPDHLELAAQPIERPRKMSAGIQDLQQGRLPRLGVQRPPQEEPDFIVWGDSHAMALGKCFSGVAREHQLSGVIATRSGTLPLLGIWRPQGGSRAAKAPQWNRAVVEYIDKHDIDHVILVGRWAASIEGREDGGTDSLIAEAATTTTSTATAKAALRTGLTRTLNELGALGVRVWILKQVPLQRFSPQRSIVRSLVMRTPIPTGVTLTEHRARQRHANTIIDESVAGRPLVRTTDLSIPFFDTQGRSRLGSVLGSYYRDDDHVSELGAEVLCRPTIAAILAEIRQTDTEALQPVRGTQSQAD